MYHSTIVVYTISSLLSMSSGAVDRVRSLTRLDFLGASQIVDLADIVLLLDQRNGKMDAFEELESSLLTKPS